MDKTLFDAEICYIAEVKMGWEYNFMLLDQIEHEIIVLLWLIHAQTDY